MKVRKEKKGRVRRGENGGEERGEKKRGMRVRRE